MNDDVPYFRPRLRRRGSRASSAGSAGTHISGVSSNSKSGDEQFSDTGFEAKRVHWKRETQALRKLNLIQQDTEGKFMFWSLRDAVEKLARVLKWDHANKYAKTWAHFSSRLASQKERMIRVEVVNRNSQMICQGCVACAKLLRMTLAFWILCDDPKVTPGRERYASRAARKLREFVKDYESTEIDEESLRKHEDRTINALKTLIEFVGREDIPDAIPRQNSFISTFTGIFSSLTRRSRWSQTDRAPV